MRRHIQLAFLKVQPSAITLAYNTFIESVLFYHLSIIFGHLIQNVTKLYNHTIKTARLLSNDQIERQTINEVYDKYFKTKCLRLTCCGRDDIIALDKLPSGCYLMPKHRVNARKFCSRSNCVRLWNKNFFLTNSEAFYCEFLTFYFYCIHQFLEHSQKHLILSWEMI